MHSKQVFFLFGQASLSKAMRGVGVWTSMPCHHGIDDGLRLGGVGLAGTREASCKHNLGYFYGLMYPHCVRINPFESIKIY